MRRSERFQLAFDFRPQVETVIEQPSLYASTFANIENREPFASRFVRSLQEPVTVRTPGDAANHLIAHIFYPFHSFDQEELWVLAF